MVRLIQKLVQAINNHETSITVAGGFTEAEWAEAITAAAVVDLGVSFDGTLDQSDANGKYRIATLIYQNTGQSETI